MPGISEHLIVHLSNLKKRCTCNVGALADCFCRTFQHTRRCDGCELKCNFAAAAYLHGLRAQRRLELRQQMCDSVELRLFYLVATKRNKNDTKLQRFAVIVVVVMKQ